MQNIHLIRDNLTHT